MFDPARFQHLMEGYVDMDLSADETRELDVLLQGSPRARKEFWNHVIQHSAAHEWAARRQGERIVSRPPTIFVKSRRFWIPAAIAACVALIFGIISRPGKVASAPEPAAVLSEMTDDMLSAENTVLERGTSLKPGVFHIRRGQARLDFYSGAAVVIQGPAEFELISSMEMKLSSGKLFAQIPPPARGFTVQSSDYTIVDHGTEFGVALATNSKLEVHVFQGEVSVSGKSASIAPKVLKGGEAIQAGPGEWTTKTARAEDFPDPAKLAAAIRSDDAIRQSRWLEDAEKTNRQPGTLIHYLFNEPETTVMRNSVPGASSETNGIVVAGEWVNGRWPGKSALAFRGPNDRIRLVISKTLPTLTLASWVRLDTPQNHLVGLLRTDEDRKGTSHWNVDSSGRLRFGILRKNSSDHPTADDWEVAMSPPLLEKVQGSWTHLATTYDSTTGKVVHYIDGEAVSSHIMENPLPITFGRANICDSSSSGRFIGRMDEFTLYDRVLPASEIRDLHGSHHPSAPLPDR